MGAILISIVSNSYYGMPKGQIDIKLPREHPKMSFETIEIKTAAVSAKRSIPTSPHLLHVKTKLRIGNKTEFREFPKKLCISRN